MKVSEIISNLQENKFSEAQIDAVLQKNAHLLSRTSLSMLHNTNRIAKGLPSAQAKVLLKGVTLLDCLKTEVGEGTGKLAELGFEEGTPEYFQSDGNAPVRDMDASRRLRELTLDTELEV